VSDTFEELVARSGLSPIFARSVLRRAVERAGLSPDHLRASELSAILPDLERALIGFLGKDTSTRMDEIRQLARTR
jgi:hypothetical protein